MYLRYYYKLLNFIKSEYQFYFNFNVLFYVCSQILISEYQYLSNQIVSREYNVYFCRFIQTDLSWPTVFRLLIFFLIS